MKSTFGWNGNTNQTCENVELGSLTSVKHYYELDQSGAAARSGNPILAGMGIGDIQDIKCGVLGLLMLESDWTDISGYIVSDLLTDAGRIQLNFPDSFEIENLSGEYTDGNGLYKLTTYFVKNKPTYRNSNGKWIVWNGTDWSMVSSIHNPSDGIVLKNTNEKPHGGIWDCDPSCQQEGRGPESPELSCIPDDYATITSTTMGPASIGDLGTGSFVQIGTFGYKLSDFSVSGTSAQFYINISVDGEQKLAVFVSTSIFPASGAEPEVRFETTENGNCYGGKLIKNTEDDNWTANLSLVG